MNEIKYFEKYPIKIPLIAITLSFLLYTIGAYIISKISIIFVILYLIYCLILEIFIIFRSCKNCYYHGKLCGLGKGRIAHWFCKKGDPNIFAKRQISFIQLIPDFLVGLIPIFIGIYILIQKFSFIILGLVILLFLISFVGQGITRGHLFCKYCKQREIGCPADKIFNKEK